jgi:hypothetical protein
LQSSIHLNNGFGETEASDDSELNIEAIPLARATGSHGGLHRLVLRLVLPYYSVFAVSAAENSNRYA